jgi:hypothetical protein
MDGFLVLHGIFSEVKRAPLGLILEAKIELFWLDVGIGLSWILSLPFRF